MFWSVDLGVFFIPQLMRIMSLHCCMQKYAFFLKLPNVSPLFLPFSGKDTDRLAVITVIIVIIFYIATLCFSHFYFNNNK